MKKTSLSGWTFDTANHLFFIILCCSTIYPFLYLLTLSLSPSDVSFAQIHIFPEKITFANFSRVLSNEMITYGFTNSIIRTGVGTFLSVVVTIMAAYPLSKKHLPHRTFWTVFITFTMFFSGGLIPSYLLVKSLGLMNTIGALILPMLVQTFQLLIARNFFMSLPEEIDESAKMDGATEFKILFRIVVPLSMPIIATLALWTAVWHWNSWFDSMIYMTDAKKNVLMVVMRNIVLQGSMPELTDPDPSMAQQMVSPLTIKAATVIVTILPIILVYPFVQKYLVKGMLVGSLKG